MKSILLAGLSLFLLSPFVRGQDTSQPISLAGKKVLWLGDSITQAGDYVTFVLYYLDKQFPQDKFYVISIGLASETVSGLSEKTHPFPRPCVFERLQRALSSVKPDIVVACYGMNDGIYHPQSNDGLQAFQDGIHKLITAAKDSSAQVILLTPPPFDASVVKTVSKDAPDFGYLSPYEGYDSVLGDYAKWEQTLPATDATIIDLHTPMNNYVSTQRTTNPSFSFNRNGGGIHPNTAGHLLMAETILKGMAISIPFDDDLNKELAKVQSDPLYAQIKETARNSLRRVARLYWLYSRHHGQSRVRDRR